MHLINLDGHGVVQSFGDQRQFERYKVRWNVALLDEAGRAVVAGKTLDVSEGGLSFCSDKACHKLKTARTVIQINPWLIGDKPKVFETQARVVYIVYSSENYAFRYGLEFKGFVGAGESILLKEITKRFRSFK